MGKKLESMKKRLGDAAIRLGEKSCGKSYDILIHEAAMPEILKREMLRKQVTK